MPTKAFLHKKSLLDQFKDDHKSTGYIQSARAEHTWNNPLTRRKRTNKLNGWIKSFQGKRHVHKLARFNAMQNENLEEAMSLKGFLSNLNDKLVNKYGLDKNKVQNYLNSHTQEMQELLDDKELSLKEKVLFVRSEITGEKDEAKKSERLFNKREMERIALSEGSKVSPYLVEIAHKILTDEYGWKASTIEEVADWLGDHKQAFEHAYGQALRSSDDDKANVKAGLEAALDEEERGVMNAEIAMMGESKEPTDEKLGYEKGHKNSRGENAPWVIRSHEDNRILASFANKKDAEEHLKRMKQYSKQEAYVDNSATAQKDYIERVIGAVQDYYGYSLFDAKNLVQRNAKKVKDWYMSGEVSDVEAARCLGGNCEPTKKESKDEASDIDGYISDVISDLVVSFHYGKDDAKKLVEQNSDPIRDNYVDGDLSAYETARAIAKADGNKYAQEEAKKSEKNSDPLELGLEEAADAINSRLDKNYSGETRNRITLDTNSFREWNQTSPTVVLKLSIDGKEAFEITCHDDEYYVESLINGEDGEYTSGSLADDFAEDGLVDLATYIYTTNLDGIDKLLGVKSEAKEVTEDEGKEALRKLSKRGELPYGNNMRTDGLSLSRIADEIRYDVATALDMAAEACEDAMLDYGYDRIYVAIADGKTPAEVAADIKGSKKTESTDDDLRSRMERAGSELLESGDLHAWEYDFIKECLAFCEFKKLEQYLIRKGWYTIPTEAKQTEGIHLDFEDTLRVPEWLWRAYLLNDTTDLEEDEIEKLNDFREKYKDYHLDDQGEEAYFSSHNDFDSLGGNVYDVDVYKRSDMPTEKKNEAYVDVIESPGARKIVKTFDWTCKKCGKPGARIADYDKDGNRVPGFFCNDCYKKMLADEKSESIKDFPTDTGYKFTFGFQNPKTVNVAMNVAKEKGYAYEQGRGTGFDDYNNVSIWVKEPQDAIRFADAIVNVANGENGVSLERSDIDKAFALAVTNKGYSENKETIDNASAEYAVVVHPFESFNGFSAMGELTDVVDFLESIK